MFSKIESSPMFPRLCCALFVTALFSVACQAQQTHQTQSLVPQEIQLDGKTYTLQFNDEFDGKEIDWDKWTYRGKGINPKRKRIFGTDGVKLDGKGNLIMTAYGVARQSLPDEYVDQFEGIWVPVTTNIRTKKEFTFGYHEVRLKMPIVKGFGMAVWLQSNGQTQKNHPGTAEVGAEIDVIEQTFFDRTGKPSDYKHSTIHWGGYGKTHQFISITVDPQTGTQEHTAHQDEELNLVKTKVTKDRKGNDIPQNLVREKWTYKTDDLDFRDEQFHTVSVLWTPDYYKFYYDGHCIGKIEQGVSHAPGYMILWPRMFNFLELVGNTQEGPGDLQTSKAKYEVDYYRVYQAK